VRQGIPGRRVATWLLLATSLAATALFSGVHLATPSDGGRVSFYGDAWTSAGIRIDPIDAPAAGLRAGDLVAAIDGETMDAWLRAAGDALPARPDGTAPMPYRLSRDGAPVDASVAWASPAVGATLAQGWSILVFVVTSFALAAYVFARRPDEPAATAIAVFAAGAAGSTIPWFVGVTTSDVVRGAPFVLHALITGPLYMLTWPAGIHLALTLPGTLPIVRRRRWIVPAVYAAALGGYALLTAVAAAGSPDALTFVGTWPATQVAIVVPSIVASLVLFAWRYARPMDPVARGRIRLATLGLVSSSVLGLVLFMGPTLLLGRPLLPAAALGLIALPVPAGLAAAILHDRLFDIDTTINRTLVYGGMTLGVVLAYAAGVAAITMLAGHDPGYGASLLATGLAALIALPLRDRLQRAVNRLMYGQRDEPWRAIQRLGSRLEWAADPERAYPAIVETVADALRLPYVALEVSDELGRGELVAERGSRPPAVEGLPLVHGAEAVGRLLLGVRAGDRGFRPDELALLRDLARQAGAAIHAERLRAALARSRERLVGAREEERRRLRHDLHDGLGPSLAAIGMRADASAAVIDEDPAAARRQLELLGDEVRVALGDVRRLVDGLRPPALDELGLAGAIGTQASRLDGRTGTASAATHGARSTAGTAIEVESVPARLPDLPAAIEVAAYRIAVEAMTNAVRHAGATSCRVRVEAAEAGSELLIEVLDDGRGVAAGSRPGTGLESMRERAAEVGGDVAIEPRPEGGTRVLARLPIGPAAPA
jgi:signal transduction histidine kinase